MVAAGMLENHHQESLARKWLSGTSPPHRDAHPRAALGLSNAAKGSEGYDGRMSRGQSP
jgi:hypothetical protein